MPLDQKEFGETWMNVGLSYDEMTELILLIDDEPVNEEYLQGIRKKLKAKQKLLRQRTRTVKENNTNEDDIRHHEQAGVHYA